MKRVVGHAGYQLLSQGIGFISGILLVRGMEKNAYAGYAICLSLTSATALVAEGGLNSVLLHIGSKVRSEPARLATLLASALRFRFSVSAPVLLLGGGVVGWLLRENGFDWATIIVTVLLCVCTAAATVTGGSYATVHRLEYGLRAIRRANFFAVVLRLILIGALLFQGYISFPAAVVIGLIAAIVENRLLRRQVRAIVPEQPTPSREFNLEFRRAIWQTLPMSLVLVLSEQSILGLLSLYGSSERIAEVTALGRIGVLYSILSIIVGDIAVPYVARSTGPGRAPVSRFLLVVAAYAVSVIFIVCFTCILSDPILEVFGHNYRGLNGELVIIAAGAGLMNLGHACSLLNQSLGWLDKSWSLMLLVPVWAALSLSFLDLSTPAGAAWFVATQPLAFVATQALRFIAGVRKRSS